MGGIFVIVHSQMKIFSVEMAFHTLRKISFFRNLRLGTDGLGVRNILVVHFFLGGGGWGCKGLCGDVFFRISSGEE